MENRGKLKAMFIIPSAIGVILFMIPVKNAAGEWTVTVKIIADIIAGAIGGFLPILSVAIVTISAVMTLVALAKPKFIMESPVLNSCFICGPFWIVVRVLGAIFAWITFLELGADKGSGILYAISSADQGGFVLYDLIGTLVIINVIASFLLPLLTDFRSARVCRRAGDEAHAPALQGPRPRRGRLRDLVDRRRHARCHADPQPV